METFVTMITGFDPAVSLDSLHIQLCLDSVTESAYNRS